MFKLKKYGTTPRTEFMAGLTTFLALAYIIAVNPAILSQTGIPAGAVMIATCLAGAIGTLIMGIYANVPFAQAPGMGLNAFFTFTVVFGLGFSWQEALAMVFLCGLVNIVIVFTKLRQKLVNAIPSYLQTAIAVGIGAFIFYIGLKNTGLLRFTSDPGTYVMLGDGNPATTTIAAGSGTIPALAPITSNLVMSVVAILITVVLVAVFAAKKKSGALLISIIVVTVAGIPFGLISLNASYFASLGTTFSEFGEVFGQAIAAMPRLFSDVSKLPMVLATVFVMSLTDTLDTVGTLIGAGRRLFNENDIAGTSSDARFSRALKADGLATAPGAILGTSNTTTFVESGAGIEAGGRTGLTAVWTAAFLLSSIFLAPFVLAIPSYATAPTLMVVGVLMMASLKDMDWSNLFHTIPAVFTILLMPFTYSITEGIAAGFVVYAILYPFQRQSRLSKTQVQKDEPKIGAVMLVMVALMVLHYVVMAIVS